MIVLIIEDEQAVAGLWQRFLRGIADDVRIAYNLPQGLELMRQKPCPDIVLLDLGLPGSKPVNTLQHIAELKAICPTAVVIVITGNVEEKLPEIAAELGADLFTRKTETGASQGSLLGAIKTALSSVSGRSTKGEPAYARALDMLERLTRFTSTESKTASTS